MTETLDAKLARIGERVAQRSNDVRARLEREPWLLDACERTRALFVSAPGTRQTKMIFFCDKSGQMGTEP